MGIGTTFYLRSRDGDILWSPCHPLIENEMKLHLTVQIVSETAPRVMAYEERLRMIALTTLETRRFRTDMVEVNIYNVCS